MLEDNERLQATREHYPYTKAPMSLLRSRYLSPYLPEVTDDNYSVDDGNIDSFYFSRTLEMTNPELAEYMRNQVWDPYSANPADEETDYEYDAENRLVEVTLW